MSSKTKIEWTNRTWNPVTGCSKVSAGCANCYAETLSERFRGVKGNHNEHGFDLRLVPKFLTQPLKKSKPTIMFVNSMSDLFHEDIPIDYIRDVCRVMVASPHHTYQILTKRHERMRELLSGPLNFATTQKHIWWGVSVENIKQGLPRIETLKATPAAVRFLSIEPLLEDLGTLDFNGIDWVIVGGESGHRARPMMAEWVRSIRDQCEQQNVPFFFKQWGKKKNNPNPNDPTIKRGSDGTAKGGCMLDGMTYLTIPSFKGTDWEDVGSLIDELESKYASTPLVLLNVKLAS